jgi:hypothetical protein
VKLMSCVIALLALSYPRTSHSQGNARNASTNRITLSGIVFNAAGTPLNDAEVVAATDLRAVTNTEGRFTLSGVVPGSDIIVRRIGYQTRTFTVETEPNITGVSVKVTLAPTAVNLGSMLIQETRVDQGLWQRGFYRRELTGVGVFFSPERLAHTQASVGTLMTEVPLVKLDRSMGKLTASVRGPDGIRYCPMNVFLDGNYLPWATSVGLDNVIGRDDVLAIEVYNRAEIVPLMIKRLAGAEEGPASATTEGGPAIGGTFTECGAIVIWSKPGASSHKPPRR